MIVTEEEVPAWLQVEAEMLTHAWAGFDLPGRYPCGASVITGELSPKKWGEVTCVSCLEYALREIRTIITHSHYVTEIEVQLKQLGIRETVEYQQVVLGNFK